VEMNPENKMPQYLTNSINKCKTYMLTT